MNCILQPLRHPMVVIISRGKMLEKDNLNGVSSNIMMGQLIPSGTGDTNVLLDEMKLIDVERKKIELEKEEEKESYCNTNIGIDFDINSI